MGCGVSFPKSELLARSKEAKKMANLAVSSGVNWRICWLDFIDAMEKAQLAASHWAIVSLK